MNFLLYLFLFLPWLSEANSSFPLFLKNGFSTIIEFNKEPSQVVIGDSQSFQIEKLKRSLVIRPVNPNTVSNLFVYFPNSDPCIFILTSSEDAEPTFHKKIDFPMQKSNLQTTITKSKTSKQELKLRSALFNSKKDFLVIEASIHADKQTALKPNWQAIRLKYQKIEIKPKELWAEREIVQRDSFIKVRFMFNRPDIPKNLSDVKLVLPLLNKTTPLLLDLNWRSK